MIRRIGLVGAGAIAREHVQALAGVPGARITHVVDRHPERASALARLIGDASWSTDPASIFTDPDIDAVDICTSPDSHADLTVTAAGYGKAIHLEKPVALHVDDVDRMLAAVESAGVSFLVGQTTRFQPVHMEMSAAIEAGQIGKPRMLHASFYAGHLWPGGWRAWQLDAARCGGHLVHNGIHMIDLAVWLLGDAPERVFARGFKTFSPDMPTPDSFHINLRFANGAMALLEWSYALRKRGDFLRRIMIVGEDGALHHTTEGEAGLHSDAANPVPPATLGAFANQMQHWVNVLHGKVDPLVTPAQIRAAFGAATAAQESYASGRAITLANEVRV